MTAAKYRKTYTCRGCGAEHQYRERTGAIPPDWCRQCRPPDRDALPASREFTAQTFAAQALCAQADPDLFTPDGKGTHLALKAKEICGRCPVQEKCLQWALDNDEGNSVYGGHTARERRALKRKAAA